MTLWCLQKELTATGRAFCASQNPLLATKGTQKVLA